MIRYKMNIPDIIEEIRESFNYYGRVVRQEIGVIPYASLSHMADELLQHASEEAAV